MSNTTQSGGIGFFGLLTLIFVVFKLSGDLTWSWWWVFAPVWVPIAVVVGLWILAEIIKSFSR